MADHAALDVVTVGEAMVLFAAQSCGPIESVERFVRYSAGAELNVAIGLSRLALSVGYVTRVGDDAFGHYLLDVLEREGIDSALVEVDERHPTGFMLKSKSVDGSDPLVEYHRGGSAASRLGRYEGLAAYCASARHLHLTGITPALSASSRELVLHLAAEARARGQSLSFDPNLRPRLWAARSDMVATLNELASLSDVVLPGLAEGRLLTGREHPEDIADFYLKRGARRVVVKLGAQGAFCASLDSRPVWVAGIAVTQVVDTVGAGDGFAVGVISALLEGLSLPDAAARGNAIGARVVTFPGDCDGLPTREQLCSLPCEAPPASMNCSAG